MGISPNQVIQADKMPVVTFSTLESINPEINTIKSDDLLIPDISYKASIGADGRTGILFFYEDLRGNSSQIFIPQTSETIFIGELSSKCEPLQTYVPRYRREEFIYDETDRIESNIQKRFREGVWEKVRKVFGMPKNTQIDLINLVGLRELALTILENPYDLLGREDLNTLIRKRIFFSDPDYGTGEEEVDHFECHHVYPGENIPRLGIPIEKKIHAQVCSQKQDIIVEINGRPQILFTRIIPTDEATRYFTSLFFYTLGEKLKNLRLKDSTNFVRAWYQLLSDARAIYPISNKIIEFFEPSEEFVTLISQEMDLNKVNAPRRKTKKSKDPAAVQLKLFD